MSMTMTAFFCDFVVSFSSFSTTKTVLYVLPNGRAANKEDYVFMPKIKPIYSVFVVDAAVAVFVVVVDIFRL